MRVVILDTETTDSDPKTCQMIEIAVREVASRVPLDIESHDSATLYHEMFKPTIGIKYGAMATHLILPDDLEDCRLSEEYLAPDDIDYVIAHNVDFDAEILGGLEGAKRICTLALARFLLPDLDSHKQGAILCYFAHQFGSLIEVRDWLKEAHSAEADVRMCAFILEHLLELAAEKEYDVSSWEKVYELSQMARIPTVMGFGKHKGTPIELGQLDRGYVQWYRRQSDTDPYYLKAFEKAGF